MAISALCSAPLALRRDWCRGKLDR